MIQINLLPKAQLELLDYFKKRKLIVLIGGGLLVLLLLFSVFNFVTFVWCKAAIAGVKAETDRMPDLVRDVEQIETRRVDLKGRVESVKAILDSRKLWSRNMQVFGETLPPYVWVTKKTYKSNGEIEIVGKALAKKRDRVYTLVDALKKLPEFEGIDMNKLSSGGSFGGVEIINYTLKRKAIEKKRQPKRRVTR